MRASPWFLVRKVAVLCLFIGLWLTDLQVTHDVEDALLLAERVIVFGPRPAPCGRISP